RPARPAGDPITPSRQAHGQRPTRHCPTHCTAAHPRIRRPADGPGVTVHSQGRVLYVIVCSAGPAGQVGHLVQPAQDQGRTVQIIATPPALSFIDIPKLEAQTGRPVRSQYRGPGEPRSPRADAIIVAPATYNTINKWAHGVSDTYALGILAEAPSLGVPVV